MNEEQKTTTKEALINVERMILEQRESTKGLIELFDNLIESAKGEPNPNDPFLIDQVKRAKIIQSALRKYIDSTNEIDSFLRN